MTALSTCCFPELETAEWEGGFAGGCLPWDPLRRLGMLLGMEELLFSPHDVCQLSLQQLSDALLFLCMFRGRDSAFPRQC